MTFFMTFFTGPVTWGEDGSLLAESKSGADITLKDEVVVDAAGHVSEPHVNSGHAAVSIFQLWADNGFQNFGLFSKAGFGQEMVNKASCSSLTFITSDSIGAGSRGTADGSEENKEIHFLFWDVSANEDCKFSPAFLHLYTAFYL